MLEVDYSGKNSFYQCFSLFSAVIFNPGSAEPKGSASICQGFRSWPVKIT